MIDYHFTSPVPPARLLPKKIEEKNVFSMVSDGVKINISLTLSSDTRNYDNWDYEDHKIFHIEFRSDKKVPRDIYNFGCQSLHPVRNPISETGYRSKYFIVKEKDLPPVTGNPREDDYFNFVSYLTGWLNQRLSEREAEWEKGKQKELFQNVFP